MRTFKNEQIDRSIVLCRRKSLTIKTMPIKVMMFLIAIVSRFFLKYLGFEYGLKEVLDLELGSLLADNEPNKLPGFPVCYQCPMCTKLQSK